MTYICLCLRLTYGLISTNFDDIEVNVYFLLKDLYSSYNYFDQGDKRVKEGNG